MIYRYLIFIILLLSINCHISGQTSIKKLQDLLPGNKEIDNWKLTDKPQKFEGDDLYIHIDGGADLYFELGFESLIVAEYENKENQIIKVELFSMKDDAAAFGLFAMHKGERSVEIETADATSLGNEFLNTLKSKYYILISSSKLESKKDSVLLSFGNNILQKIKSSGKIPDLISILLNNSIPPLETKFFRGHIGFNNIYLFLPGDIFNVSEGVFGQYEEYQVFILKYSDAKESKIAFRNAQDQMESSGRFFSFKSADHFYTITDKNLIKSDFNLIGNYILIVSSNNFDNMKEISKSFERKIIAH
ncbi:DUF6599 family protein [Bacteroidota bacterium]